MNSKKIKHRIWLCLPPFVAQVFDATMTLSGQPAAYWDGDYSLMNEFNPIYRLFLNLHPLAFVLFHVILFGVLALIIILLPLTLSKALSIYLVIANTFAGFLWLRDLGVSIWIRYGLLIIPSILLTYVFALVDKYGMPDKT